MESFNLGPYLINFSTLIGVNPVVEVLIANTSPSVSLWKTVSDGPFIKAAFASVLHPPINNGNYQLEEDVDIDSLTNYMTISPEGISRTVDTLSFSGVLSTAPGEEDYDYTFSFSLIPSVVADLPYYSIDDSKYQLKFDVNVTSATGADINRLYLSYWCHNDESFYGFGESFSYFNLKGRNVPIVVSEQGLGRGLEPITSYLNTNISEGVGGHWYTTYAPKPVYLTNYNRSIFIDQSDVMFFNLNSTADNIVELYIWNTELSGRIFAGSNWFDLIELITSVTGRQPGILPAWSQQGAVVGLEGGTKNVSSIVSEMKSVGVPVAGVWLQDWVGLRHSWDGDRLIWNWELNEEWYPGWSNMVADWAQDGTKVLTYISPFFSDPAGFGNFSNNFFQEGIANGYFVKHADGTPYKMYSLSIEFCMLDPTNPEARQWMKNIIINEMLVGAKSSGWMCDFGEYLPFDAALYSGESASSYHNRYPQDWASINVAAIKEANAKYGTGDLNDIVFFMRSAWVKSPASVPVFWLGDQLVSWDADDGLKSAITGALSSGLTGHAITHSDIGGYNVVTGYGPTMYYVRTPELLKRWSEFAAFGSGLYRTHIGSSTTTANAQVYDSLDSLEHFAKFANIFANLSSYRQVLLQNASKFGYPLIRPMALHYAYDENIWSLGDDISSQPQYLFGPDVLVAPVVESGTNHVNVYLPKYSGKWVHLWSGEVLNAGEDGASIRIYAPVGFPFVAFQEGSIYGAQLLAYVSAMGYCDGYSQDGGDSKSDPVAEGFAEFFGILIPILIILFLIYVWFGGCGGSSPNVATNRDSNVSWHQNFFNWLMFGDMSSNSVAQSRRVSKSRLRGQSYDLLINPGEVVSSQQENNEAPNPQDWSSGEKGNQRSRSPPPSRASTSFDSRIERDGNITSEEIRSEGSLEKL